MLQAIPGASLKGSDLRAILDTLGAIGEAATTPEGFARQGIASLKRLVASELTRLSMRDLDFGHRAVVCAQPGVISRREIEVFDRHFHANPLVLAHGRNPHAVTHRISDLVAPAQFRATPLFSDYYRRVGVEYAMAGPIHVKKHVLGGFRFHPSGRDFSDRGAACLEALRPPPRNLPSLGPGIGGPPPAR